MKITEQNPLLSSYSQNIHLKNGISYINHSARYVIVNNYVYINSNSINRYLPNNYMQI